jgi:hypothetical protein
MNAARKKVDDEWMTLQQAASELGCTRHLVLSGIVRGELTAQVIAGRTVVSRSSVMKRKAQRERKALAS